VLIGLDLPDGFVEITSHRRGEHLISLDNAVGIDDKPTADVNPGVFIVTAIHPSEITARIGKHRERNPAVNHLGQFMFVPHFVDEYGIDRTGEYFYIKICEFFVRSGDRR